MKAKLASQISRFDVHQVLHPMEYLRYICLPKRLGDKGNQSQAEAEVQAQVQAHKSSQFYLGKTCGIFFVWLMIQF